MVRSMHSTKSPFPRTNQRRRTLPPLLPSTPTTSEQYDTNPPSSFPTTKPKPNAKKTTTGAALEMSHPADRVAAPIISAASIIKMLRISGWRAFASLSEGVAIVAMTDNEGSGPLVCLPTQVVAARQAFSAKADLGEGRCGWMYGRIRNHLLIFLILRQSAAARLVKRI